jgi:hypothetical protein
MSIKTKNIKINITIIQGFTKAISSMKSIKTTKSIIFTLCSNNLTITQIYNQINSQQSIKFLPNKISHRIFIIQI